MTRKRDKRIFSRVNTGELAGRTVEAERIYLRSVSGGASSRLRVAGEPGVGTSELLRHTFDRLFLEQRFVVPFYFAVRADDRTARDAAARYLYEFLLQAVAFRLDDPGLTAASPDIRELREIAPLPDAEWVSDLCDACEVDEALNDEKAFIRSAIAAPLRAAAQGRFRFSMFIDDLHESAALQNGSLLLEQIGRTVPPSGSSVFLGSRRKLRIPGGPLPTIQIEPFGREEGAAVASSIADELEVDLDPSVSDLLSVRTGGNARFIRSVISGARAENFDLRSYRNAARSYTSQLIDGEIGEFFEGLYAEAIPDEAKRRKLVTALASVAGTPEAAFTVWALKERVGLEDAELARAVERLSVGEVIDISSGSVRLSSGEILREHLNIRRRIDSGDATAASAAASETVRFLQSAPLAMGNEYRREAASGLRELLLQFDLQTVPRASVDYRFFRDRYKGLSDEEIRTGLGQDEDTITLPQIVHASPLSSFVTAPAFEFEPERAIAATGFSDRSYGPEDDVVWIAAEVDFKLEADAALVREWCERLDDAAKAAELRRYRIWLVAPEGFTAGAIEILAERGGFGSSRRQLEFLRDALKGGESVESGVQEFEMVIPNGDEAELIAAHAIEEIARRNDFPAKAVNQIKTALVEACINAAEHGLSPGGKIYQKFAFHRDRVVITVSNRGLRLTDKMRAAAEQETPAPESRRGWGLGLMRSLMDDVRVEAVDDGTRIVMTKMLSLE